MNAHTERRFTALTPIALVFTAVSLCWTGWSIADLIESGAWVILAAVSVDGLWGVVQYLSYKRIGGRVIEVVEWVTLIVACSLLAWHGWTITPAAAFAGALPPIVAKISWVGDIRLRLLRSYDPTALTVEQEAEINDVIRDSEYQARLKAAEIEREAAEDIAAIRAKGKVDMERLEVDFEVGIKEITTRADLRRRTPVTLNRPGCRSGTRSGGSRTRRTVRESAGRPRRSGSRPCWRTRLELAGQRREPGSRTRRERCRSRSRFRREDERQQARNGGDHAGPPGGQPGLCGRRRPQGPQGSRRPVPVNRPSRIRKRSAEQ